MQTDRYGYRLQIGAYSTNARAATAAERAKEIVNLPFFIRYDGESDIYRVYSQLYEHKKRLKISCYIFRGMEFDDAFIRKIESIKFL